ncbi:DUF3429 domain-containing protein [Aurantiacibacter gangjinensis]|uniref:Uncharacterized protein n=1 Tax=Aurantiacibacter gangjinensis TaxID=502682 RepID=A0A0G9MML0_9SPHN|nr:DUF3429 domain-containing protein [Aurantiacibacter gangjinensis]APE27993.1 hypothetical protein BMF35_a1164 [Aurantiacibacter gangjinensis]KLE31932.1 hypothetical protein AAW01_10835 [Aurantiacibacter gangjinensis]
MTANRTPRLALWLGFAGLLPQLACLAAVIWGGDEWRWTALALAWAYAALIFSFLGGLWWGLAAAASARIEEVDGWVWIAAVFPSLFALATYYPWIIGEPWPGPSLLVLGAAIMISPIVDYALKRLRPPWWMALRIPLSLGLGGATITLGVLAGP